MLCLTKRLDTYAVIVVIIKDSFLGRAWNSKQQIDPFSLIHIVCN